MAEKRSTTSIGSVSPIVVYADGKESKDVASQFVRIFPANAVGPITLASTSLRQNEFDGDNITEEDAKEKEGEEEAVEDKPIPKAPSLSDIQLVSNTLVYDAAGNPSATVVFKVRNSSGEEIKSVNARVQVV